MALRSSLILVAGYPGTGKSTFCDLIQQRHPELAAVSIDDLKEAAFDRLGFDGIGEKKQVEDEALIEFFAALDSLMSGGTPVISEHPFSDKQRGRLADLCDRHGYRPVTVRFVADLRVLFVRQRQRDLDPTRHPGHILTAYHRGDQPADRRAAPALLSWSEFEWRCRSRGYGDFQLGPLLEVDTTDFGTVDYAAVVEWVVGNLRQTPLPGGGRRPGQHTPDESHTTWTARR